MGIEKVPVEKFVELAELYPILDVRSEGEYDHAHIPEAFSLPLFSNEERAVVGTIYKQQSREDAIKKGLEYFGPKMRDMILFAEKIINHTERKNKTLLVHCWRGGMRSAGVAWLMDLYGFKVYTLIGGYKAFRNWTIQQFTTTTPINILGGYTGSGKTIVLDALSALGEPVIDLENLAGHKGSAFGNIGLPKQPSQEMFENKLGIALYKTKKTFPDKRIWIEDESQRIGTTNIPQDFWLLMRSGPIAFLDIPFDERLNYLVETYGKLNVAELKEATLRIQKRLGGLETKLAVEHIENNNIKGCFSILLKYYDKHYQKALDKREDPKPTIRTMQLPTVCAEENAKMILNK
ncbi:MAG: tRNA 2-selenouridine(34) synthase MnmH [bacterium]|jgi:tRNA 2-selenouridine synthase